MKCSNCGGTDFDQIGLEGPTDDGWWHSDELNLFVCKKCGHVEMFMKTKSKEDSKKAGGTNKAENGGIVY